MDAEGLRAGKVCGVLHCKNYGFQKNSRTFHRFPKDKQLCSQWVHKCRRPDLCETFNQRGPNYLNKVYRVCSDHFEISDYNNPNLKSQGLKPGTVPSVNLPSQVSNSMQTGGRGTVTSETYLHSEVLKEIPSMGKVNRPSMAEGVRPEPRQSVALYAETPDGLRSFSVNSKTGELVEVLDNTASSFNKFNMMQLPTTLDVTESIEKVPIVKMEDKETDEISRHLSISVDIPPIVKTEPTDFPNLEKPHSPVFSYTPDCAEVEQLCTDELITPDLPDTPSRMARVKLEANCLIKQDQPYQCDLCDASFKLSSNLNLHRVTHCLDGASVCPECGEHFMSRNSLKVHLKRHEVKEFMKCDQCTEEFSTKSELDNHKDVHHNDLMSDDEAFPCMHCPMKFSNKKSLKEHKVIHIQSTTLSDQPYKQNAESPAYCYKCTKCNNLFEKKSLLLQHLQTHTDEGMYKCEFCGQTFIKEELLQEHLSHHEDEKSFTRRSFFKCPVCKSAFPKSSSLQDHIDSEHPEDSGLIEMKYSSELFFECEICHSAFRKSSSLQTHIDRAHPGPSDLVDLVQANTNQQHQEKLQVPSLENVFFLVPIVMNNQREPLCLPSNDPNQTIFASAPPAQTFPQDTSAHPTQISPQDNSAPQITSVISLKKNPGATTSAFGLNKTQKRQIRERSMPLIYNCEKCDKSFCRPYKLRAHMISHSNERPYKCDHCSLAFKTKSTLVGHSRTQHSTQRKHHQCEFCSAAFLFNSHKLLHISYRHSSPGDAPQPVFECQYCSFIFENPGLLKIHMTSAHPTELAQETVREVNGNDSFPKTTKVSGKGEAVTKVSGKGDAVTKVSGKGVAVTKVSGKGDAVTKVPGKGDAVKDNSSVTGSNQNQKGLKKNNRGKNNKYLWSQCPKCKKSIKKIFMHRHLKRHQKNFRRCKLCEATFHHAINLRLHMSTHCKNMEPVCRECGKCFSNASNLKAHTRNVHELKEFVFCSVCDASFFTQEQLNKHSCVEHDIEPPSSDKKFSCTHCSAKFKYKSKLKIHNKTHINARGTLQHRPISIHNLVEMPSLLSIPQDKNLNMCRCKCGKIFKREKFHEHLKEHVVQNKEKYSEQDKSMAVNEESDSSDAPDDDMEIDVETEEAVYHPSESHLDKNGKEHLANSSSNEMNFSCKYCPKKFSTEDALKQHIRICTRDRREFEHVSVSEKHSYRQMRRSKFPYICLECGKYYKQPSQFLNHLQKHPGERPFKCDACDLGFKEKEHLQLHNNSRHKVKKNYQCKYCPKMYASYYSKRIHINRVHVLPTDTTKPWFKCQQCSSFFPSASRLSSHISRLHTKFQQLHQNKGEGESSDVGESNNGIWEEGSSEEAGVDYENTNSGNSSEEAETALQEGSLSEVVRNDVFKARKNQKLDGMLKANIREKKASLEKGSEKDESEEEGGANLKILQTFSLPNPQRIPQILLSRLRVEQMLPSKSKPTNAKTISHREIAFKVTPGVSQKKKRKTYIGTSKKNKRKPPINSHANGFGKKRGRRKKDSQASQKEKQAEIITIPNEVVEFICSKCGLLFTRSASLKAHIKMVHESEELTVDNEDRDSVPPQLSDEENNDTGLGKTTELEEGNSEMVDDPEICVIQYPEKRSKTLLDERKQEHHNGDEAFEDTELSCKDCLKKFNSTEELFDHISTRGCATPTTEISHLQRPIKCPLCQKRFCYSRDLSSHSRLAHKDFFKCDKCDQAFKENKELLAHTLSKHNEGKQPRCDLCQAIFFQKSLLREHVHRMHIFPNGVNNMVLECPKCSCIFRRAKELEGHIIRRHTSTKSDQPSQEKKRKFSSPLTDPVKPSLEDVVDADTKEDQPIVRDSATGLDIPDSISVLKSTCFACSYCVETFEKRSDLVRHIRMHTHNNPYKCKLCYCAFVEKASLTFHSRTHLGRKVELPCLICDQIFFTPTRLKMHQRLYRHGISSFKSSQKKAPLVIQETTSVLRNRLKAVLSQIKKN